MARMRSLKPEFWADEELACHLTRDERLMYLGLWNLADEHSRLRGDPRYIKGQLFPYDDDITAADIEKMLANLAAHGKAQPYTAGVGRYLFLPNLAKHQRLETDKVPSRLPAPDESTPHADESESRANESARGANEPEPGADVLSLKHVAGGIKHVAGGMGSREPLPATILGTTLLEEHVGQCRASPPRDVIGALGRKIDTLLDEKQDPDVIRQALGRLRQKPNLGPGALPSLVNEILQVNSGRPPSGRPPRRSHQPYQDPPDDRAYEEKI